MFAIQGHPAGLNVKAYNLIDLVVPSKQLIEHACRLPRIRCNSTGTTLTASYVVGAAAVAPLRCVPADEQWLLRACVTRGSSNECEV